MQSVRTKPEEWRRERMWGMKYIIDRDALKIKDMVSHFQKFSTSAVGNWINGTTNCNQRVIMYAALSLGFKSLADVYKRKPDFSKEPMSEAEFERQWDESKKPAPAPAPAPVVEPAPFAKDPNEIVELYRDETRQAKADRDEARAQVLKHSETISALQKDRASLKIKLKHALEDLINMGQSTYELTQSAQRAVNKLKEEEP